VNLLFYLDRVAFGVAVHFNLDHAGMGQASFQTEVRFQHIVNRKNDKVHYWLRGVKDAARAELRRAETSLAFRHVAAP
jgi:hypothetical protein